MIRSGTTRGVLERLVRDTKAYRNLMLRAAQLILLLIVLVAGAAHLLASEVYPRMFWIASGLAWRCRSVTSPPTRCFTSCCAGFNNDASSTAICLARALPGCDNPRRPPQEPRHEL